MKQILNKAQIREQQLTLSQNTHQGKYMRNMRHGQGRLDTADGQSYAGNFEFGLRSGYGECQYLDGSTYKGQWADDRPFGEGLFVMVNGDSVHGFFFDGFSAQQQGTIRYKTGEVYIG